MGFEEAGFESVASVDLWSDAIDTFNHNRETKTGLHMDIKEFNRLKLPEILSNNLMIIILSPTSLNKSVISTSLNSSLN